ncbi:MAG: hypothetical protein AB1589_17180 [Cyanobacteriota bacterium]
MRPEVAHRRIEAFGKRFGEAHLYLAYHAAFPLALTPDLLYRLWANFQRDIHGEVLNIPWIAVADLLLSSLCDEVGHELYEMEKEVRDALLSELKANSRFGTERINELSDFLLAYVRQQLDSPDIDTRDFAQTQRWTALAYSRPSEAARELALALNKAYQQDTVELVRIASLAETLIEPLAKFEPLLMYARGIGNFARGDQESAAEQLSKLHTKKHKLEFSGVSLHIPPDLIISINKKRTARKIALNLMGEWLFYKMGEKPVDQKIIYERDISWPLEGKPVRIFLIKYRLKSRIEGIGFSGPTTWSFLYPGDYSLLIPEDLVYCYTGWYIKFSFDKIEEKLRNKNKKKAERFVFSLMKKRIIDQNLFKVHEVFMLGENLTYYAIEVIKNGKQVYLVGTQNNYIFYSKDFPPMQLPPLFYFLGKTFDPFKIR